jgi:hypothetical protein
MISKDDLMFNLEELLMVLEEGKLTKAIDFVEKLIVIVEKEE